MTSPIPSLTDINVFNSLDEQVAVAHFLGKDLKQAEELFRANFLGYQEDLMWMGPRAFCFYVDAAIAYLVSPEADDDADAINCFCGLVEFQLEYHRKGIEPAFGRLRAATIQILRDFVRFDCDPTIYGDLVSRYQTLLNQLTA